MAMLILIAALAVVAGFALVRHWQARRHKKTLTSPYRHTQRRP
ncbi:hypothetical protein [Erwinia psidii]|nr:hypothetical protein [Erwinia psidii]